MTKKSKLVATVDEYIAAQPPERQLRLKQMRACIKKAAPKAVESISYQMPGYKLIGKPLVYFAGFENHIGFYATPTGQSAFAKDLAHYKQGKGSVQFPNNEQLPLELIAKIVKFRVKENEDKYGLLKKK